MCLSSHLALTTNLHIYVSIIFSSTLLKIWFVLYKTLINPYKDNKVVYLCTSWTRSLHCLLVKLLPLLNIYVVVSVYMREDCFWNSRIFSEHRFVVTNVLVNNRWSCLECHVVGIASFISQPFITSSKSMPTSFKYQPLKLTFHLYFIFWWHLTHRIQIQYACTPQGKFSQYS